MGVQNPPPAVADPAAVGIRRGGLTTRTVVIASALIAAIWLFTWHYFSGQVSRLEREAQVVSARYLRAQEELSATRADVYRASILVRDLLLSPEPPVAAARREPLDAYASADARLAQYQPVQPGGERTRIEQLRSEIAALRQATSRLITTDDAHWAAAARTWRLSDLRPRRETAIRIANDLQSLNRDTFLQNQLKLLAFYADTQWRLATSLALALLASLGIAVLAARRVTRLERHLFRQHERDLQNQQDLQRLSAALITAQEEERRSIARELHDEVGQVLTAIKVELSMAARGLTSSGQREAVLDDARSITDRALHTVRDLSRVLHPAMLDDIGLTAALEWYVRGYSSRYGIIVDYDSSGLDRRLASEIEINVYRIVQEALTNVIKHAETPACAVRLWCVDGMLRATVTDSGRGFDVAIRSGADSGLGLIGMRERAALVGGVFTVVSAPGQGTRIAIAIPVRWRDEAREERRRPYDDIPRAAAGQEVLEGGR